MPFCSMTQNTIVGVESAHDCCSTPRYRAAVVWSLLGALFVAAVLQNPGQWIRGNSPMFRVVVKPTLRFVRDEGSNNNGDTTTYSFRILQVADIHLGENSWTDWGPEQDRKTWKALDGILTAEKPDLILLTGDQLSSNNVDKNATAYYELLASKLEVYGIPWAMIFGNHDDQPYENPDGDGTVVTEINPAKTSREQLVMVDKRHRLSLSEAGPADLNGVSNYWLNIHWKKEVAARIVLFDSGGGSLPQQIVQNQIDWFWENQKEYGASIPIFAFEHIPSTVDEFEYSGDRCSGMANDGGVAPLSSDAGIVAALAAAENVQVLGVGHNHGNDYCCKYMYDGSILNLCFGRHSGYGGYGGYGSDYRGSRVYRLELDAKGNFVGWTSYVRMETSEIVDEFDPRDVAK